MSNHFEIRRFSAVGGDGIGERGRRTGQDFSNLDKLNAQETEFDLDLLTSNIPRKKGTNDTFDLLKGPRFSELERTLDNDENETDIGISASNTLNKQKINLGSFLESNEKIMSLSEMAESRIKSHAVTSVPHTQPLEMNSTVDSFKPHSFDSIPDINSVNDFENTSRKRNREEIPLSQIKPKYTNDLMAPDARKRYRETKEFIGLRRPQYQLPDQTKIDLISRTTNQTRDINSNCRIALGISTPSVWTCLLSLHRGDFIHCPITTACNRVFFVRSGGCKIRMGKAEFGISRGDQFFCPSGRDFEMCNEPKMFTCDLLCTVSRDSHMDDNQMVKN